MANTQGSQGSSNMPSKNQETTQKSGSSQHSMQGDRSKDMKEERTGSGAPHSGNTGTSAGQYSGGSGGVGGGNR